MKLIIAAALIAASLSACATAPAVIEIENSRTIPQTKDQVWSNLVEYFASSNITIKTIEKDSGIIYAERMFGRGYSIVDLADCGADPMAVPASATADLNVFVRERPGGVTTTVNARFHQQRVSAWDNSISSVDCSSLGTIERTILDAAAVQ